MRALILENYGKPAAPLSVALPLLFALAKSKIDFSIEELGLLAYLSISEQ